LTDFAKPHKSEVQTGKPALFVPRLSRKGLPDARRLNNSNSSSLLRPNRSKNRSFPSIRGADWYGHGIPPKLIPARKEEAHSAYRFYELGESNRDSMQINGGAVPVHAKVQPSDIHWYQTEKTGDSKMYVHRLVLYAERTTARQEDCNQV